jgi:hypothetical protein
MNDLGEQMAKFAAEAVALCQVRGEAALDYSEASLTVVESMLAEAAQWATELGPKQQASLIRIFGAYLLEVARREFGGRYAWHNHQEQPVLVVGEPAFCIAILSMNKMRGRVSGDTADNIPFFYSGFAERARRAVPGDNALFV